jgi:hypothetical protein
MRGLSDVYLGLINMDIVREMRHIPDDGQIQKVYQIALTSNKVVSRIVSTEIVVATSQLALLIKKT